MAFSFYSKDQDLQEVAFQAAMYWRVLYGTARVFLAVKLLSVVGLPAITAYQHLLRHELSQDPNDFFVGIVGRMLVQHGFAITYFLVSYLLFWGLMDIILSISMLRHSLWAFNVSVIFICIFVLYELYRFSHTHSHILFGFILIDAFMIYIIRHERTRLIARRSRKQSRDQSPASAV